LRAFATHRGTRGIGTGLLSRLKRHGGTNPVNLAVYVRANTNGNPETVRRYLKAISQFVGWLGSRKLTLEAVQEFETWASVKYRRNSLQPLAVAVNLYLRWKGADYRMKRPPREIAANPKLVTAAEYESVLARVTDPAERLVVRVLHDSLLRPSDVVTLRLADLSHEDGVTVIRRVTKKTGAICESVLSRETADELRDYLVAQGIADYIFPFRGKSRHRTWPNAILRRHGAEGISPRTFRRSGATAWGDDLASLMAQGGWTDPKTVLTHYRKDVRERHIRAFERAIGPAREQKLPAGGSSIGPPNGPVAPSPPSPNRNRSPEVG